MEAKSLYFDSLKHFLDRNKEVLPQALLQTGANERWFVREFCLAMNRSIAGTWSPSKFGAFADPEVSYVDLIVVEPNKTQPTLAYEVKLVYSTQRERVGILKKASDQLDMLRLSADEKLGLFVLVYCSREKSPETWHQNESDRFCTAMMEVVRQNFTSDEPTVLCNLQSIDYTATNHDVWWIQSWITWGKLRPSSDRSR